MFFLSCCAFLSSSGDTGCCGEAVWVGGCAALLLLLLAAGSCSSYAGAAVEGGEGLVSIVSLGFMCDVLISRFLDGVEEYKISSEASP